MHHLLLFVPLLALVLFLVLPWQPALVLYLPLMLLSLFGYWKALKAQRQPPVTGKKAMIGDHAKVVSINGDEAEVEYHGELWSAVSSQPLQPGQRVIIKAVEELTLQVEPSPRPFGLGDGQERGDSQ